MPSFQIACCTEEKWFTHTLTQSSASFRFCCDFNIEQTPSLERVCVTGWSWQWSITRSQQSPKQTSVNTCSSHINHHFLPSPLRFSCLLFWQLRAWGSCHSRWRATESQTLAERREYWIILPPLLQGVGEGIDVFFGQQKQQLLLWEVQPDHHSISFSSCCASICPPPPWWRRSLFTTDVPTAEITATDELGTRDRTADPIQTRVTERVKLPYYCCSCTYCQHYTII